MSNIEALHRAAIAAALRYDEANHEAVVAAERAKSMLAADLAASLKSDRDCHRAFVEKEAATKKYREALYAEVKP